MTLRDYLFFDCKPLKFTLQLTFLIFGDMILIKFGKSKKMPNLLNHNYEKSECLNREVI